MYTGSITMGDTNTSFQVPGGQTWPLRKLCAQEPSPFLNPRSFLFWPAILLLRVFPAPGNTDIFWQ